MKSIESKLAELDALIEDQTPAHKMTLDGYAQMSRFIRSLARENAIMLNALDGLADEEIGPAKKLWIAKTTLAEILK